MTLLLDSSVWLAWTRERREPHHAAATALLARRMNREVELRLLDLTLYELGNVVVCAWKRPAREAEELINRVTTVASSVPLVPSAAERSSAHALAAEHGLSVYDATYAAVARARRLTLVTADRQLLASGQGVAPADV